MGPFVGGVEAVCGLLIIVGLLTRLASIPLLVIMVVAIVSTKLPILIGHDLGPFTISRPTSSGPGSGARSTRPAPT